MEGWGGGSALETEVAVEGLKAEIRERLRARGWCVGG